MKLFMAALTTFLALPTAAYAGGVSQGVLSCMTRGGPKRTVDLFVNDAALGAYRTSHAAAIADGGRLLVGDGVSLGLLYTGVTVVLDGAGFVSANVATPTGALTLQWSKTSPGAVQLLVQGKGGSPVRQQLACGNYKAGK